MLTLLTNGTIISSESKSKSDILICNNKIIAVRKPHTFNKEFLKECTIVDISHQYVFPGLIDGHSHFLGASGEAGAHTRAPEIASSSFLTYGITTVVGLLGMDTFTRSTDSLIAKTRALNYEGLNAYCLTGSYCFPPKTLTGNIGSDIYFLSEVIGVGEVAISDYRSSSPTTIELTKMIKDALVACYSKGIKGIIVFHVGNEKEGINQIIDIVASTQIDPSNIMTTHINRNKSLMKTVIQKDVKKFWIDITSIYFEKKPNDFYHAEDAISYLLRKKPELLSQITVSSDSGCMIEDSKLTQPKWLYKAFKETILTKKIPMEQAVQIYVENPAKAYGLTTKGYIKEKYDADFFITNKNLEIQMVFSKGKKVFNKNKQIITNFYKEPYE